MNPEIDQDALNLAKAIRRTETQGSADPYRTKGKSGEYGAYQFMPTTYKNLAKQHLGDENAEPTVENQNKIAYSEIKRLKDAGHTPAEIASYWNSGKTDAYKTATTGVNKMGVKYDVPDYVAKVSKAYNEIKTPKPVEQPEQPKSNVMFPSSPTDTGLTAGLKAIGNTPQSAVNFAKGAIQSVNPINTVNTIGEIGTGFSELSKQQGAGKTILDVIKGLPKAAYETLTPQFIQSLAKGDVSKASQQVTEDPFGQVAPVVLTAVGGAKVADTMANKNAMAKYAESPYTQKTIPKPTTKYSDIVDKGISTVSKPVISTVEAPFKLASKITKSATSQLIGLEPESISQIISNPKEFSKLKQEQATRGNLASEFGKNIDNVEQTLQDTGEAYNSIRKSNIPATVPKGFVDSVLGEFGFKVKGNKVVANSKSLTRNMSDLNALNNFYKNWGKKQTLTPTEYLNMRKDIAGIAKFGKEIGTNVDAQTVGTKLYERANQTIRPQIKGLKELDDQYSPQRQEFNQIKKDFLEKDTNGEYKFKEGAINKIANATGKGKDALLARMEEVMPGVTKKIQILKTVEDIQKAYGNKVGTYARGVIGGGSLLTGNIAGIIATIISNPTVAVPLLRGLGYTASKVAPIVSTLKLIAGDANKLPRLGVKGVKSASTNTENNPIRNNFNTKIKSKPTENKPNSQSGIRMGDIHSRSITSKNR